MSHDHSHNKEMESTSLLALFLNLGFVVVEIIGGILTNSVAIMSDAVHDFGDVITLLISYILIKVSSKKRNKNYTFGFGSLLIIGSLINTVILLVSSGYVFVHAIMRVNNPEEVRGGIMFFIAIVGVLVNGISVFKLGKQKNVMSRSLMLHLLEDTLGWIGVFISSIFIYFYHFYFLDTVLSFVIAGIIFINAFRNIKDIMAILTYKVPKGISIDDLQNELYNVEGVLNIYDIRIWTVDGQTNNFSAYLLVDEKTSLKEATNIKNHVKELLKKYNIAHSVIEIEIAKHFNHEDKF